MTTTISIGAIKLSNLIAANASNKLIISHLESSIENKNDAIQILKDNIKLSNEVISARDKEVEELDARLIGIRMNLPIDNLDQAPESTKEFIRRLQGGS